MEAVTAIRTLELLADGRDPQTGLSLPSASPFNQPLVVRSLFAAIRALESGPQQYEDLTGARGNVPAPPLREGREAAVRSSLLRGQPANAGKPWTADEDLKLCSAFDEGVPIKELASQHGRSTTALNARLFRLGKIADPGIPLRQSASQSVGMVVRQPVSSRKSRQNSDAVGR